MSDTNETLDEGKQPLIQHLVELRSRLIKSLILITVMFVVAYIFADTIYNFLVQPYACLLYTSPSPRDGLLSRMPSSA